MRISVDIINPQKQGELASIYLCFDEDGESRRVKINLFDFEKLHDFTYDVSSIGFDFLLISAITYGVDDLFSRKKWSFNGWTRELEICFPVKHLIDWQPVNSEMEKTLGFLTGDIWTVSFTELTTTPLFVRRAKRWSNKIPSYRHSDYDFVSLFSGGLDSLIGVIDRLHQTNDGRKGLLVSHFDSTYSGPKLDQDLIIQKFKTPFSNKFTHIRSRIGLSGKDSNGDSIKRDTNQRSRSILFIGLGTYLLEQLPNANELLIPENGTISLNHPLTPSRGSSLSTRTTHPYFLRSLELILNKVGIDIKLKNDFSYRTKGQMVESCLNQSVLSNTYADSASCGKRGHKVHWSIRNSRQCGICMPCVYRRAALHRNSLDDEIYGNDILNLIDYNTAQRDVKALLDYLENNLSIEDLKRNLIVNGSIDNSQLDDFAKVVEDSRTEILTWMRDKGGRELKEYFGW